MRYENCTNCGSERAVTELVKVTIVQSGVSFLECKDQIKCEKRRKIRHKNKITNEFKQKLEDM